jgi:hypothetical protein
MDQITIKIPSPKCRLCALFNRVCRLEIQSVMLVFSTGSAKHCHCNLISLGVRYLYIYLVHGLNHQKNPYVLSNEVGIQHCGWDPFSATFYYKTSKFIQLVRKGKCLRCSINIKIVWRKNLTIFHVCFGIILLSKEAIQEPIRTDDVLI